MSARSSGREGELDHEGAIDDIAPLMPVAGQSGIRPPDCL